MLKIKDMYEHLLYDETICFQVKNKKAFVKIINEMKKKVDKWDFMFIEDELNYENTYFLIGMWRGGMFEIRLGKESGNDDLHICADYKEAPLDMKKHLNQIESLINIMDKYRESFVKKRLYLDKNLNLVKKID